MADKPLKLYIWTSLPPAWRFAPVAVLAPSIRKARDLVVSAFCDGEIAADMRGERTFSPHAFRDDLFACGPMAISLENPGLHVLEGTAFLMFEYAES